jgi:hypothetical protein
LRGIGLIGEASEWIFDDPWKRKRPSLYTAPLDAGIDLGTSYRVNRRVIWDPNAEREHDPGNILLTLHQFQERANDGTFCLSLLQDSATP